MEASFKKYTLNFKQASGTSRGVYTTRDSWFIFLSDGINTGIGECAPLPGLSMESPRRMSSKLLQVCDEIGFFTKFPQDLREWPSIVFGLETALLDLKNGGKQILFPSEFTAGNTGIPINGLIWMGTPEFMKQQIRTKIEAGFRCIKLKIGALDFNTEFELLKSIRKEFSPEEITLRVDANGAFSMENVLENLKRLSDLRIHSIEQPIEAGNWNEMAELCLKSPVPIALDEELIGITTHSEMQRLVETIRPAFLILKPTLHGGFATCESWIELAEKNNTGWWITSALESNIGLNAIAQWAFHLNAKNEQGLGTGQLFTNNFDSPLEISGDQLWHRSERKWDLTNMNQEEETDDFF
ncbi:MAG: o-succinylbenzoate synthase [Prolixibacteraceae bacterium]